MTNLASLWSDGPWSPVEVCAELPAPPEEVLGVLADPETYPEWLVGAERIQAGGPELAEPRRRLDLEVHAGPFHGVVDFEVARGPAGTTRICFREATTGTLAVLTPLLRPIVYARNGRSLRKLADYLESHRAA